MEVRQGLTFVALFFTVSVQDMISFGLAFWWRTRPEFHRRLMFVATCALTSAAFARIPWVPGRWFYTGVDCLILLGVVRDLMTMKRIHPVYLWGLPLMMLGQIATKVVNAILG